MIEDHKGEPVPEEYRKLVKDTLELFALSIGHHRPREIVANLFLLIETAAGCIEQQIGQDRTVYLLARMLQRLAEGSEKANIMVVDDPDAPQ